MPEGCFPEGHIPVPSNSAPACWAASVHAPFHPALATQIVGFVMKSVFMVVSSAKLVWEGVLACCHGSAVRSVCQGRDRTVELGWETTEWQRGSWWKELKAQPAPAMGKDTLHRHLGSVS